MVKVTLQTNGTQTTPFLVRFTPLPIAALGSEWKQVASRWSVLGEIFCGTFRHTREQNRFLMYLKHAQDA
jgi:hypothetical protein